MANLIPKNFYVGNGTASNVYTVSATTGSYSILRNITICNTTSLAATCDIHILGASGVPGNNNAIFKSFTVNSYETISYEAPVVWNESQAIYVVNTSNKCTFTISGVEYSA